MQRKRLMFYINTLGTGGAERVMSQLANRFSAEQYEVMLALSFPVAEEYPLTENIKKVYLEEKLQKQSQLVRNVSRIRKLRKLCMEFKPDLLISFMAEPNFRAIVATVGLPVKTIISVRKRMRSDLGLGNEDVLYGHVGTFSAPKNHKFLIHIFEELYKKQEKSTSCVTWRRCFKSRN